MESTPMRKPADLAIADIPVGTSREFSVVISTDLLDRFAALSGDDNPLHMEERYARATKFGRRIAHGMLLASFFSRLVGMHLPGKRALYLTQSLKFRNPAFIGDEVRVKGTVVAVSRQLRIVTIKTVIANSAGENLVEGEARVSVL